MTTKYFNWIAALIFGALVITSCQKSDLIEEESFTAEYTEIDLRDGEETNGITCFQFVYPITLILPDGSEEEIASREDFQAFVEQYRMDNPGARRPRVQLPVTVIKSDGSEEEITRPREFLRLRRACKRQRRIGHAVKHCFDVVYPVMVVFPDGTTTTVDSATQLQEEIKAWKDANPDATERPQFQTPFDVELPDGSVITIEDREQMLELLKQCVDVVTHKPCYQLIFPVTVDMSDGTEVIVNNPFQMKELIQDWRESNPTSADRPEISYPHEVTLPGGDVITLNSAEEAKALMKKCRMDSKLPNLIDNGCFSLDFPVTLNHSDGTSSVANSSEEYKNIIIDWRAANGFGNGRTKIDLPFTVTLKSDGSTVTISSYDDLKELFKTCREG